MLDQTLRNLEQSHEKLKTVAYDIRGSWRSQPCDCLERSSRTHLPLRIKVYALIGNSDFVIKVAQPAMIHGEGLVC